MPFVAEIPFQVSQLHAKLGLSGCSDVSNLPCQSVAVRHFGLHWPPTPSFAKDAIYTFSLPRSTHYSVEQGCKRDRTIDADLFISQKDGLADKIVAESSHDRHSIVALLNRGHFLRVRDS